MVPTSDHWLIQEWALQHGAIPAQIRRLKYDGEPAILTFLFGISQAAQPDIYPIAWETFFAQFDLLQLAIAFDETSQQFDIVKVDQTFGNGLTQ